MIKAQKAGGSDLTVPIDITDPKLAKAYAHPLRIQILGLLDDRVASPREISAELGTPLSNTSYHVRQLVALGFVELVRRTARRGAIEHHYTARVRPTITDEGWADTPSIVKRAIVGGLLEQSISGVLKAVEEGGFDHEHAHHSRTAASLDEEGWKVVAGELARALAQVEAAIEASRARTASNPEARVVDATILMMQFAGSSPKNLPPRRSRGEMPEASTADLTDLGTP